ncbi:MAG: acetyl-CoA synthetase, partial [Halobacteria archaeon]|nr:acetyl-CoA synthetase [Halobacteria archaeon]
GEGDTVALRGRLSEPAVVVAGVVSPLVSDATLVLPVGEERCDFGVGSGVPDREEINPEELNV